MIMWSSAASFIGKGLGALGRNASSSAQRFVKDSAISTFRSAGNGITNFLNSGQQQQEQQRRPSVVTSTLLPLALSNPAILIPLLIVFVVVGLLIVSFAFITYVTPWPTGLFGS